MKNVLEVKVHGGSWIGFEIAENQPQEGHTFHGDVITAVKPFTVYSHYEIPDGVYGYELYTVTTEDHEYHVAVETHMPMDEFIANLYDNDPNGAEEIDIETAEADLRNFTASGWMLPDGMTAKAYMKAWNAFVAAHKE